MSDSTEQTAGASQAAEANPGNGVENPTNGVPAEAPVDWKALVPRLPRKADAPPPAEMTIAQAAEYLDVPRSYIVKRVRSGELPCRTVKKRRRIPRAALDEENEKIFQRAKAGMSEMTRISEELGLYDDLWPKKEQ